MAKKRYAQDELTGSAPQPSFLGNLGSGVLSGISTVANVLDTPGSMVRDTLGGKNPFDQLLAPHKSDNRLTGRDLLRKYGLVGKKDTWGNFAGGMAAEIALDPLTYIGLGGLTRAGKVAKSAGLLDDATRVATASGRKAGRLGFGETAGKLSGRARTTLGDVVNYGADASERLQKATHASQTAGMDINGLMNQPLGGIANIGIPGFPKINIGASEAGAKFAEGVGSAIKMIPGADLVSQGLGHANRVRKGFFHAAAGGFFDKYGQEIAGHAYDKLPAAKKTMLRQVLALKDRFDDLHRQFKEQFNPAAVPGSLSGTSKFNPGDWVQATDRGNYGQVVQSGKDTAQVHFTNPQTGATATVEMPHTNLMKKDLPAGQSNLHDPTARVLDRIVKMTAETKGDIDAAVTKFGQNQPISPELKGHIKQLAEDYVTAKDSIWQMNLEMGGKGRVLSEWDGIAGTADSAPAPRSPHHNPELDGLTPQASPSPRGPKPPASQPSHTWQELNNISDTLQRQADDATDALIKGGMSVDDALKHPSVTAIDNLRFAHEQKMIKAFDREVKGALSKVVLPEGVTLTGDNIDFLARDVYSSHPDLPAMTFEHGFRALENKKDTVARLAKEMARQWAESRGVDWDGLIGNTSGLTQAGKDELVNGIAEAANKAHDAIGERLLRMASATGNKSLPSATVPPTSIPIAPSGGPQQGQSGFQHFPRYAAERGGEMPEKWKVLPMGHPSTAAREGALRYLRQDEINDLLKNPKYRGKDLGPVSAEIMNDYGHRLGYEGADGVVDTVGHAEELAKWINQHGGSWVKKQKDLFDNLSIHDLGKYLLAAHKRNASLDAIHHAFVMNLTEGGIPVADAFKAVGMDADKAMQYFSKVGGINLGGGVPPELVNAAKAVFKTYEVPEWQNAITKTLDWANGWFKPSVTMVKPAFWVRNHTSGQYANLVSGYMETPADLMQYMESYKQAMDLWKKNDPAFMRELQVEGIMGLDSTWDATKEGLFSAGMPGQSPYPDNPLKFKQTFQEVGQKMAEQPTPEHPALKFIAEKTAKPRQAVASYMASNSKANRAVEYANRSAMYIYLKGKGYDPTQAAKIVESIHFNYSGGALSPFENTVMKRIIPFYVFSRNSLPWAIERLIEKPSGGLGQTLRALNRAHKPEDMAPEYIGETASVPLGDLPDGSRRYLTGVGLNFEDPAQFATPSLKSAGLEVLSRMNPILKAPLEYATGQSFFQKGPKGGRDIEDLDPLLGRTLSNIGELTGLKKSKEPVRYPGSGVLEHMISNSPLTGFGTAVRTLTDPRKSPIDKFFNLGTGLRLTDVSPASQDKELRNRINRAEKQLGAKTYIDTYVPKETKAQMSPQELQAYMQIQALRQLLEERSKERKKK
jgi:hypothetical protein